MRFEAALLFIGGGYSWHSYLILMAHLHLVYSVYWWVDCLLRIILLFVHLIIVFDFFLQFFLKIIKYMFFHLHVSLLHFKLFQQLFKIHVKQLSLGTQRALGGVHRS